jgi:hypothetical protein
MLEADQKLDHQRSSNAGSYRIVPSHVSNRTHGVLVFQSTPLPARRLSSFRSTLFLRTRPS